MTWRRDGDSAGPGARPPEAGGREAPIRGVLFDKDGTLFDFQRTWGSWSRALIERLSEGDAGRRRALATALHFDLATDRFLKTSPVIAGTLEVVAAAIRGAVPERRFEALERMLVRAAADVRPVEATPLAPLLDRLRAHGLRLGVATNDAEAATRAQLAGLGVLGRFDFVAGYDSGFGAKPGTGMHWAFCARFGLKPQEVAMVGDSTHDLHSGRAAGMVALAVLTGPADAADLAPHADAVLPDIGLLPGWLEAEGRLAARG